MVRKLLVNIIQHGSWDRFIQEEEFLVRKLLVNMGVGKESRRNRNSW